MATSILDVLVPKLRRSIGDNDEPFAYADSILEEYLMDSVENLTVKWQHGFTVDREAGTIEPDVDNATQYIFILNAQVEMARNKPRINFSVGDVSVRRTATNDNTKLLEDTLNDALRKVKMVGSLGKSTTEHDTYENRIQDWLENILYR